MILATFIVMLAAFNLSPRSDLQQKQDSPLAEAAITKFLVQHDAAVKYAKAELLMKHNNPSSSYGIAQGNVTVCADNKGKLCSYLPLGFKYEADLYYSTIYCLNAMQWSAPDENGQRTITKYAGVDAVTNCNDSGHNSIYVITYGRVPQRWKNVSTNRIIPEFYNAMHNQIAVGSSAGIIVPKTVENDPRNRLNSNLVIEGIDVQNNSIPSYFIKNDATVKSKCLSGSKVNSTYPCLIYVTHL